MPPSNKKIHKFGVSQTTHFSSMEDKASLRAVSTSKHTGSHTNESVRQFSNAIGTKIPSRVKLSLRYTSDDNSVKTRYMVVNNPKAKRYDAGHKFGQQYGGIGTDKRNIFPQNPTVNRFPNKGRSATFKQNWNPKKDVSSWRRMENKIKRKVDKYQSGVEVRWKAMAFHK